MGKWVIPIVLASVGLVAVAARAQTEQVVLAPSVFATEELPSNAITKLTVTCSPGYVATSAGISSPAPGTTLLSITPGGPRAYRFRFGNPFTNTDQRVTVTAACRKVRAHGNRYVLRLEPLSPKRVVVPAGGTAGGSLECPSGTVPAGGGVDLDPKGRRSAGAYHPPAVSIRRMSTSPTSFAYSLQNSGTRPRMARLYGSCLTLVRAVSAAPEQLHVEVTTFHSNLHAGPQQLARRCRSGWFSLSAGFVLRSRLTRIDGAFALGKGARWTVTSSADGQSTADLQLACGRLAP